MANILFMGFEKLSTNTLNDPEIWDINTPGGEFSYQTGSVVRSGGSSQCLRSDFGGNNGIKTLGANYAHLFAGSAWMFRSATLPATYTDCDFTFFDSTTAQVGWAIRGDGSISVHRGSTTASAELGRTATGLIVPAGTGGVGADYRMVEMEVVFHASAGTVTIKVADVTVLTLTSQNTAPSGNAFANRFKLVMRNQNYIHCDDLYINDNSGSSPDNSFYGEAFVVEGIQPNGDGNSSQWVGSDGNSVNNSLLVDDNGNGDTDYVKSGTLNDLDTYAFGDLSNTSGTVIGVNHYLVARKDDVVVRTIASALRISGTNYISGTNKTMTGSYRTFSDLRSLSPASGVKFTISEINGMEAGQKVTT